jgi:hypothetical protein
LSGLSKKEYKEVSAGLTWRAVCPDKVINQYNADGTQNSYDGLERSRMTAFALVNGNGAVLVTVPLNATRKLFYRMRVALFVGSHSRERIYIVGWQSLSNRQIWVVDSVGQVKMFKDWIEKSQWLYPPHFRSYEMPDKVVSGSRYAKMP